MNLLIFNLGVDKYDAPLAFTIDWINEFAKHCDNVIVLTMKQGEHQLASNVKIYDIGHGKGYSKIRLVINFYRQLFYILRTYKIDGCFSHMNQLFSALGGWVLKAYSIKLVTWYAHASVTTSLKIAHFFSDFTVASVYEAYPYRKNKLKVIGQGIDISIFKRNLNIPITNTILYSGRISKVKDIITLIKAFEIVHQKFPNFTLLIVGDPSNSKDQKYLEEIKDIVSHLGVSKKVRFESAVERNKLPDLNCSSILYINLTAPGSGDKVAWEAMACEVPTLVANSSMTETLGKYSEFCYFEYQNEIDLSKKMETLLSLDSIKLENIGKYLRNQVIKLHSLEALPPKVLNLLK